MAKLKGWVYWNPCVCLLVCQGAQGDHCFSLFFLFNCWLWECEDVCGIMLQGGPEESPKYSRAIRVPQLSPTPPPARAASGRQHAESTLPAAGPPLPTALFSTLGPAVPAPAHRVLHARFGVLVRLFPVPAGLLALPARPFSLLTGSFSTRIQVPRHADGQLLHVQHAAFCTGLAKTFTRPNTLSTIPARLITIPATVLDCHPNLLD